MWTVEEVKQGEEITMNRSSEFWSGADRAKAMRAWNHRCDCSHCTQTVQEPDRKIVTELAVRVSKRLGPSEMLPEVAKEFVAAIKRIDACEDLLFKALHGKLTFNEFWSHLR